MTKYDVIIIGGGAAGLSAARAALANGRRVLVLDMGDRVGRKISVSGGGRCNFTNTAAKFDRYFGHNPEFTRSALSQVSPADILGWARAHGIKWFEKSPGQFFCETTSEAILDAMLRDARGADIILNTKITTVEKINDEFVVNSKWRAMSVIVATGGISFPALGVSDFGYVIAKKFGHKIIPIEPGLVGLKTDRFCADLAGISLPVTITAGRRKVSDSLLFTHFGIGGPAAYRASMFSLRDDFYINFLPDIKLCELLTKSKRTDGRKTLVTLLSAYLPSRFARWVCTSGTDCTKNIADYRDADLAVIANKINDFIIPGGTLKRRGLDSAEVVIGGVSTDAVSSKTMESKLCPGLFFAGEVLDIAGDLGGFNLHWAFASGLVAGKNA